MKQAKRLTWLEALMDHADGGSVEGNREDAAQWLGYQNWMQQAHLPSGWMPMSTKLNNASLRII